VRVVLIAEWIREGRKVRTTPIDYDSSIQGRQNVVAVTWCGSVVRAGATRNRIGGCY
jgi:hypothetical protein